MDASDTDNRQNANQTPCALCSIDCVVTGDDDGEEAGAVDDEFGEEDVGAVEGTETLGEVEGLGLSLLLHAPVNMTIASATASNCL